MKISDFSKLCVAAVATLFVMSSCSSSNEIDVDYAEYVTSDDYKKDLDNFFFAGSLQQAMTSLMIHACSNEFTCTEKDTVNFGDRKLAYWRDYAIIMATIEEHQEEFKESYRRLHEMGVFDRATPQLDAEGNIVSQASQHSVSGTSYGNGTMNLLATPAYAGTIGNQFLFAQAFYEFCGITSDLSRESRKTVVTVAAKLSDYDRQELYNELSSHERQGARDYKEWWNNFADGKYDVEAHRIYRTLMVAKDSPSKTNYLTVADDMGILREKEFTSKAGRAVTAGAKLYVECINKVVGNAAGSTTVYYGNMAKGENIKGMVLSYDGVYDILDKVNNSAEYVRSHVNGTVKQEDIDEYNINLVKAIVSSETDNVVVNLGKNTKIPLDGHFGGGEFVEYGQVLYNVVKKYADAKNDPKLTWGTEEERMAQIKITDKDGKPTGMIIARDKETGAIYAVKEKDFNEETSIRVPAGDYNVTAIDKDGNKQTITDVEVSEGESKNLDVVKNEQEIIQKLIEMHKDDSEGDYKTWWEGFKERRAQRLAKEKAGKPKTETDEQDVDTDDETSETNDNTESAAEVKDDLQNAPEENGQQTKTPNNNPTVPSANPSNQPAASQPAENSSFSIVGKWNLVDVKVSGTLANEVPEAYMKGKVQEFKDNGTYSVSGRGSGKYKYNGGDFITLDGKAYRLNRLAPNRITITYSEIYFVGKKKQDLKCVLTLVKM